MPLSCNLWTQQSVLGEYQRHISVPLSVPFYSMFHWVPLIIHLQHSLLLSSDSFCLTAITPPLCLAISFPWNIPSRTCRLREASQAYFQALSPLSFSVFITLHSDHSNCISLVIAIFPSPSCTTLHFACWLTPCLLCFKACGREQ